MNKFIIILSLLVAVISCGNIDLPVANANGPKKPLSNKPDGSSNDKEQGEENKAPKISFTQVYNEIIQPRCTACHRGAAAPNGLNMENEQTALKNLIGIASKDNPNVLRVKLGDSSPESSYLMAKLVETEEFRKPPRMPFGGPFLSEEELELVGLWIETN